MKLAGKVAIVTGSGGLGSGAPRHGAWPATAPRSWSAMSTRSAAAKPCGMIESAGGRAAYCHADAGDRGRHSRAVRVCREDLRRRRRPGEQRLGPLSAAGAAHRMVRRRAGRPAGARCIATLAGRRGDAPPRRRRDRQHRLDLGGGPRLQALEVARLRRGQGRRHASDHHAGAAGRARKDPRQLPGARLGRHARGARILSTASRPNSVANRACPRC